MRKSEYRERMKELDDRLHPRNFHCLETKEKAVSALVTHRNILSNLFILSRRNRSLKQIIIDYIKGE